MGEPLRNFLDEIQMYDAFLVSLSEEIEEYPESVLEKPRVTAMSSEPVQVAAAQQSNAIFIIHGHDELNLMRLKEQLRDRWSLEPLVLSATPGKGRTLIEKFEEEAQRAIFAMAVLTPDDTIEVSSGQYSQARPNVIFELGWFYGRLGRDRVCILFKEGTHIHSDLDGVSRIQFNKSILEKIDEIERELKSAGVLR